MTTKQQPIDIYEEFYDGQLAMRRRLFPIVPLARDDATNKMSRARRPSGI
jgi:hypothetical protein